MKRTNSNLEMLLAIEQNLIKQIEMHKKIKHPRILKKLEKHLKTIQHAIDNFESHT